MFRMEFDDLAARLNNYGRVLFAAEADRQRQIAFGREREVQWLVDRLRSPGRKPFLLLGPAGSGKSAIIREAARRLASMDEPWVFVEMSSSMLLTGTQYLGELETRLQTIVDIARHPDRVVIYFTDLANLLDVGKTSKTNYGVSNFFQPLIESGQIVVGGECTPETYRNQLEHASGFVRLFDQLKIHEATPEQTREILQAVSGQSAETAAFDHRTFIEFAPGVLELIREASNDYFPGHAFPGKALRLLTQVIDAETRKKSDAAVPQLIDTTITSSKVLDSLESSTGIPRLLLDDQQMLDMSEVRAFFEARIVGQNEAVDAVVDLITLIKAGVTDPKKPMGVYLFVGPTGVGKTELVKALAEFIFGSPDRMLRFDMSEFKDYNSFEKLIGNPQAGPDSPVRRGSLVSQVRQQPFSVVLFDEVEKAHDNIFDLFLQLFDDGRLTDAAGQVTHFTKTIVVMTSNVGSDLARPTAFGFKPAEDDAEQDRIREELRKRFRPEFINRLDRVLCFQPLKRRHMRTIAEREVRRVLLRSGIVRRDLRIDVEPGCIDVLLKQGFTREFGARPLKRAVERLALLPLAREIVKLGPSEGPGVIRLQPIGNALQAKVVAAPKADKPAAPPRLTIEAPGTGRKLRVSADDWQQLVSDLGERCQGAAAEFETSGLFARRTELMDVAQRSSLWDRPDHARELFGELHYLERLNDGIRKLTDRCRDLQAVRLDGSSTASATLGRKLVELERDLGLLEYGLRCRNPLDRADAVVCITLVDRKAATDDIVGNVANMYLKWAKRKEFTASIIHEDLLSPEAARQIVLLVDGISVFGVLRGEIGIHEFVYDKSSQHARETRYVSVRVLPLGRTIGPNLSPADLEVAKQSAKGKGKLIARYKADVVVTHQATSVSVRARSGADPEQTLAWCEDWLRAELASRESPALSNGASEQVVRRYNMRPHARAVDQATGLDAPLKELWLGDLDPFLQARLVGPVGSATVETTSATTSPVKNVPNRTAKVTGK